jgi:peptidyl-prolyl cis-trans isomerase SurA
MTDEEFQSQLKKQNMTMDQLRDEAGKDLAIKSLQDKNTGRITVSDKEVEDYYDNNKYAFVKQRGVGLSMIVADPADNSAQGILEDAKSDTEAKTKIDNVAQQLRDGTDFGTMARVKSEDANSLSKEGDIGFATEKELRDNGFAENLINQFFVSMSVGETTPPTRFSSGKWYIFKLTQRQLQTENLTLDSPGVRQQITDGLINQQKDILNAQLLTTTMNEAKIVNYLAANKIGS